MGVVIKMIGFHVVDVGAADARHVRHVVATTLADVAKIRVAVPTTDVFDDYLMTSALAWQKAIAVAPHRSESECAPRSVSASSRPMLDRALSL
jgi:hypothetical protein